MALGKPKLVSKTPDSEDTNSLLAEGQHDRLLRHFTDPNLENEHTAIIRFGVQDFTVAEGGRTARIIIRHIEVPVGPDLEAADKALLSSYKQRTNNTALPRTAPEHHTPLDLSGLDPVAPATE